MSAICSVARLRFPAMGGEPIEGPLGAHVATCLACQAEQARYRKLRLWLGDLRHREERAPLELAAVVGSRISTDATGSDAGGGARSRTTVVAAAGAAVVAAAVIVGIRRSRAA